MRLSLGATRGRIVRQLLAESLVLALAGAAAGLALAFTATAAIRAAAAANLPRASQIAVDWRVLGFAVLVSLATALVFGLVPALQASRPDLNATLVEGGRANTGGRNRTRHVLVVAEVAIALVLLAGAGLLVNSFVRLLNVPPGFDPRTRARAADHDVRPPVPPAGTRGRHGAHARARSRPSRRRSRGLGDDAAPHVADGHPDPARGPRRPPRREVLLRLRLRRRGVVPRARHPAHARPALRREGRRGRSPGRGRERDLRPHALPEPGPARAVLQ